MLAKIRSKGVEVSLSASGQLESRGKMTSLQRAFLREHEASILLELWKEDGTVVCPSCGKQYDYRADTGARYGQYTDGIICGPCMRLRDE